MELVFDLAGDFFDFLWILGDTWDMNYSVHPKYQKIIYVLILVDYIVLVPCLITMLWCLVTSSPLSTCFLSMKFWLTMIPTQWSLMYFSPTYLNLLRYTVYPCLGHFRRRRLALWKEKMKTMETGWAIKMEVRQSLGKGLGVFACEDIPKGKKVYVQKPNLLVFMSSEAEMEDFWKEQNYDDFQKGYFLCHCLNDYFGNLMWAVDESLTLLNHHEEPNLVSDPTKKKPKEFGFVAARDIKCGEEMTMSYWDDESGSLPAWFADHEESKQWLF